MGCLVVAWRQPRGFAEPTRSCAGAGGASKCASDGSRGRVAVCNYQLRGGQTGAGRGRLPARFAAERNLQLHSATTEVSWHAAHRGPPCRRLPISDSGSLEYRRATALAASTTSGRPAPWSRREMRTLARRVGLGVAARGDISDLIDWTRRAQDAGLDSVWIHDSYFERDAATYGSAIASALATDPSSSCLLYTSPSPRDR